MTISIVVAERPPLLEVTRSADGAPIYSGFLWELLPTLLQQAHINETYTAYEYIVSQLRCLFYALSSWQHPRGWTDPAAQHLPHDPGMASCAAKHPLV